MKPHSKLSHEQQQQQQQQHVSEHRSLHETAREFATAEEVLRFDAEQTTVPPTIAHKLQKSLDAAKPRPWWKTLLGK